jgi:hypothetical protein
MEGGSRTHLSPKRMPASGTHICHTTPCIFAFSPSRFTVSASGRALASYPSDPDDTLILLVSLGVCGGGGRDGAPVLRRQQRVGCSGGAARASSLGTAAAFLRDESRRSDCIDERIDCQVRMLLYSYMWQG